MDTLYKLSPSDFRYLWADCKHCYYLKVKKGVSLPSIGIPGVFMKMNSLLQNSIVGMNMQEINSDLPNAIIEIKEGYLKSSNIPGTNCYISGRFDILSKTSDGTHTIIDFKISDPKEEKIQKFAPQLHAYKFALENPLIGEEKKISKMGVIVVSPESIEFVKGRVVFHSSPQWYEIKEDMDSFSELMKDVHEILSGELPAPSINCAWCKYRTYFPSN